MMMWRRRRGPALVKGQWQRRQGRVRREASSSTDRRLDNIAHEGITIRRRVLGLLSVLGLGLAAVAARRLV